MPMNVIRPREYKTCGECGHSTLLRDEAYGCATCLKPIDLENPHVEYLDIAVFFHGRETQHNYVCGIPCMIEWLKKFRKRIPKDFYFLNIPLLSSKKKVREFVDRIDTDLV